MRIGSRGSSLARAQADHVARLLGGAEVVILRTSGDEPGAGDGPPAPATDKSRWVDTIEQALLAGEIDLAVHSAKDVPSELAPGLALLGAPPRAPVQDALCGAGALGDLPQGARVGTSSLRRTAQLLAARPDLELRSLKGNVDTRLAKLGEGELDAIVLAQAGLVRLGREAEIGALLDPDVFVPSPGQGALALEGRAEDASAAQAARSITDEPTLACLRAEREFARALAASCNTPLGACCRPTGDGTMRMRAWVGLPDGSAWIADELHGEHPLELASALEQRMRSVGAAEMLAAAEAMAL
jgi:hydroxymethylbilane synthase